MLSVADRLSTANALLQKSRFDLILLDLGLPDSQGLASFTRARKFAPEIPIIILSGLNDEVFALQAMQAGAQDYLMKDAYNLTSCARAIRYAIERNKLHSNLRESEQRFSTLFFQLNSSSIRSTHTSDYSILEVNDAWINLTGYTRDEAIGHTATELGLVKPEVLQQVREILRDQGDVNQFEVSLHKRSGQERFVLVSSGQIHLGGETYILNSLLDITERKQAEDVLKESETRFSKVFFTNPVSQSIISPSTGQVMEVNDACCRLYEYSREELIGTAPGKP